MNVGRVTIEYDVVDGVEQPYYSAAIYSDLTAVQVALVQKMLDEIIRPNWNQRSCVPS